jgi:hypothetical protein
MTAELDEDLSILGPHLAPPPWPGNDNPEFQEWRATSTSLVGSTEGEAECASDSAMQTEDGEELEILRFIYESIWQRGG